MKTLAMLSRKGGVGKTTLTVHLAVAASLAGKRVLIADMDPQASASDWWRARKAESPELVEVKPDRLKDALKAAAADGVDLVVLDTRPSAEADAAAAARLADLALLVTRPGFLDLHAIAHTVDVVRLTKRPAAIVLNACPPGRGNKESAITIEAREALGAYAVPICPVSVSQRAALTHALNDGRAVTEFEPEGRAAQEIGLLWKWTGKQLWPNEQS